MENKLEICGKQNRNLWKTKQEYFAFLKENKARRQKYSCRGNRNLWKTKQKFMENRIEIYGKQIRNLWKTKQKFMGSKIGIFCVIKRKQSNTPKIFLPRKQEFMENKLEIYGKQNRNLWETKQKFMGNKIEIYGKQNRN